MTRSFTSLVTFAGWLSWVAFFVAACAAPLGPGYIVDKQEIRVSFAPEPAPVIHVAAEYRLKNTGTQELSVLDVRLPDRRFHLENVTISWDGTELGHHVSPENPRIVQLRFPQSWTIGTFHTLRFLYEFSSANSAGRALGFSSDAFYLPAESWTPELPQARGLFGFGGVPPKKWELLVAVPQGFLIHASGGKEKRSGGKADMQFRFSQTSEVLNPFVVAGRYRETRQDLRHQTAFIWNRSELNTSDLQRANEFLSRTLAAYDALLGARGKAAARLWIVECPSANGCFTRRSSGYTSLLSGGNAEPAAEMISNDTVIVDPRVSRGNAEALLAPALAESWLGYGQNPGFYEQEPPMSALPAFTAALAREITSGPGVRSEIVSRALAQIPAQSTIESNNQPAVTRAKSLLLFYALRDRVGADAFRKALQHMLVARRGRGFDVTDLVAAIDQESHQQVGPFVRQWIKRPGVPEDFRIKYSQAAASQSSIAQEATQ